MICQRCGRTIGWNDGAACWVVRNQALPPACRLPSGEVVRGHLPDKPAAMVAHASELPSDIAPAVKETPDGLIFTDDPEEAPDV